jgi:hypothetical protein
MHSGQLLTLRTQLVADMALLLHTTTLHTLLMTDYETYIGGSRPGPQHMHALSETRNLTNINKQLAIHM